MSDRVQLIADASVLMRKAAAAGDDRASATLYAIIQALVEGAAAEMALAELAAAGPPASVLRQRRYRERKRNALRNVTLSDGSDVTNVTPSPSVSLSCSSFLSPSPELPAANTARAREETPGEPLGPIAQLLRGRMNGEWCDVQAFLDRRPFDKWEVWAKEMLREVTGGAATEKDLARVCRDDAVLERQLQTPKALRGFLASAVQERRKAGASPRADALSAKEVLRRWAEQNE